MNRTQTENTKELDKSFEIDCSDYPKSQVKVRKIKTTYRAICNKCNSEDCQIIEVIENENRRLN